MTDTKPFWAALHHRVITRALERECHFALIYVCRASARNRASFAHEVRLRCYPQSQLWRLASSAPENPTTAVVIACPSCQNEVDYTFQGKGGGPRAVCHLGNESGTR